MTHEHKASPDTGVGLRRKSFNVDVAAKRRGDARVRPVPAWVWHSGPQLVGAVGDRVQKSEALVERPAASHLEISKEQIDQNSRRL